MEDPKHIKLVLSGSGSGYPVFAGVVRSLEDHGYTFELAAGTSGGSLIAACVSAGYRGEALYQVVRDTLPVKNGIIRFSLVNLFKNWGLIDTQPLEALLCKYLPAHFKDVTMPLYVVTSNLNEARRQVFSTVDTPDTSIAQAIIASISIPFVFSKAIIGQDIFVDGGITSNLAVNLWPGHNNVVGVRFTRARNMSKTIGNIIAYAKAILNTSIESSMTEAQEDIGTSEAERASKIAFLNSDAPSLSFNMSEDDANKLMDEGYKLMSAWIETRSWHIPMPQPAAIDKTKELPHVFG